MTSLYQFSRVLSVGFFAIFMALGTVQAAPAEIDESSSAEEIQHDIIEKARLWIRKFNRDTYLFHYRPRPETHQGYIEPQSERTAKYYSHYIRETIDNPSTPLRVLEFHDWFGDGLYAAVDPIISANYGGRRGMWGGNDSQPWILYRFTMREGSKYLAVVAWHLVTFPKKMRKALQAKFGCPATNMYELLVLNTEKAKNCRPLVRAMISELEIDAILYPWKSYPAYREKFCPETPDAAFYITKRTPFEKEDIVVMTEELPPGGADEAMLDRQMIQRLFYFTQKPKISWRWPSLNPDRTEKSAAFAETKKWADDHLFRCNKFQKIPPVKAP
jgi:hypothetical protein